MKRECLWDNLKFVAILCIVLLHCTMPYAKDGMSLMRYVNPFIDFYPMTLFAIISGYWYKERSYKELVILFLWPCILFTIILFVLGNYSNYPNYVEDFSFKPGYAMWYLMALFLYSMATKWIRQKMGIRGYLLFAFLIAFAIGCIPISNRYFDIQRTSCLFPCFAFGLWLRESATNKLFSWKKNRVGVCTILFVLCILLNLTIIRYKPNLQVSLKAYYGLDLKIALAKWMMIIVRVVACTCLIILFPDKEYWFTKYGSRTMNVYLLHTIPVFMICWGLLYNYRYEWYGFICFFIGVPLICTFFFSTPIGRFMKKILFFNYLKSIRDKFHRQ